MGWNKNNSHSSRDWISMRKTKVHSIILCEISTSVSPQTCLVWEARKGRGLLKFSSRIVFLEIRHIWMFPLSEKVPSTTMTFLVIINTTRIWVWERNMMTMRKNNFLKKVVLLVLLLTILKNNLNQRELIDTWNLR